MYWLRTSVEKVVVNGDPSARAIMTGKEIANNKIMPTSTFFLIAGEFISFAPFLMLILEQPFLIRSFAWCGPVISHLRKPVSPRVRHVTSPLPLKADRRNEHF